MRWIIGSSLKFRYLVVAAAAAMMLYGAGQVQGARTDAFPEFAPPRVEVQTICVGLSSEETEELVTVPLEQALNGVARLAQIRSTSVPQLSSVELIFKRGTDLIRARQVVQERLATVVPSLPTWAAPPVMRQPISTTSRVMHIGLSSNAMSLRDLSTIAYWKIRARLLRVRNVVNVAIWGERLQQQHVDVDPARMWARRVSLDEVMNTTADSLDAGLLRYADFGNVIGTGGFVDTANQRLGIRHVLPITTPADLGRVPIRRRAGRDVRLRDVADVVEGNQQLAGDAVINSGPGLLLVVEKAAGANTVQVTRGVDAALKELAPGLPGIRVDASIFRQADFIETAIDNLTLALLLGCLLVIVVLSAFLFQWRTALISLLAIPLSLMAAVLVLYLRGDTINTMILAGLVIAVGVVVDDAIIDVENIWRRLRERGDGTGRLAPRIILEASLEVRSAIWYATLINVLAVVPVFFLQSVTGSFFEPLAFSYALAILVSMVVALTVTPALSLILLSKTRERRDAPLVRWCKRAYGALLSRTIRRPRPAYIAALALLLAGLAAAPTLGQELYPAFKERDFLMHWITPPGTSHPEERRIVTQASRELRALPGVRNFGSHIGQAFLAEEVVGANFGENWVSIDPKADYDKTVDALQETVDAHPGLYHDVQTYLRERIDEVLAGAAEPIVVRIFGPDLRKLRSEADRVREALSGIDGMDDLHVDLVADVPEIHVREDLARAERYGLKPGDVRRAAAVLVSSEEVGDIFRGGRAYDVHVWSTPRTRHSLTDIRNLPIDTPARGRVRLSDVAAVHVEPTPNTIHRQDTSRRIDIAANVSSDRSLSDIAADVRSRLAGVRFATGYHAELLGEAVEQQGAQDRLLLFAIAAAIGILLLLQAAFRSTRVALMFFLTLPMALVGGVLAVYLIGGTMSLGSYVGFLAVFGIAARNGILLINHCQHLEREEGEPFGPALVLRGATERLSPILMTALATALALVPLVVAGTIPGHEIEHPMALVILGGLATSTFVNLFVVPALYLRFGRSGRPRGAS
ncbi:MAG: efflux RND transporter permease subunit [Actinomycetota bacterium]|nr:efflux RND transporter permease subunit [Actinomycetota bacterium]